MSNVSKVLSVFCSQVSRKSAELAAEYGIQDVDLEYSDVEFKNLTSFNLFLRMIRPQIVAVSMQKMSANMAVAEYYPFLVALL